MALATKHHRKLSGTNGAGIALRAHMFEEDPGKMCFRSGYLRTPFGVVGGGYDCAYIATELLMGSNSETHIHC